MTVLARNEIDGGNKLLINCFFKGNGLITEEYTNIQGVKYEQVKPVEFSTAKRSFTITEQFSISNIKLPTLSLNPKIDTRL